MVSVVNIAGRAVGPETPCMVVADVGVNHNGDIDMARRLIDAARAAGADAVKLQTYRTDRLMTREVGMPDYARKTLGGSESWCDLLRRLELSEQDHKELKAYADRKDLLFLSTPFDEASADFLERLGVPAFKVSSGDLTNLPLLSHLARKDRPIILSTGMSDLTEVEAAVAAIRGAGLDRLVVLHCVTNYPADPRDANLRAMRALSEALDVPTGFSDHTVGTAVAVAAVVLGACVIEKHITLSKSLPGPDHHASAEPMEFVALVQDIRTAECALGDGRKRRMPSEENVAQVARKSVVTAEDLAAGTVLTRAMLAIKRPGTGLPPSALGWIEGRVLRRAAPCGTPITREMVT